MSISFGFGFSISLLIPLRFLATYFSLCCCCYSIFMLVNRPCEVSDFPKPRVDHAVSAQSDENSKVDCPYVEVIRIVMVDKLPNLHVVFLSPETEEGQRHEHCKLIPEQKYLKTD